MENYKKRYEDLYERISNLVRDYDCVSGLIDVREELKSILNESQESEDESVRKHLLKHFMAKTKEEWNGMPIKNIIAWLEKRGEQPNKVSIWKHWKDGIAGNGEGKTIFLVKNGNTYSFSSCLGCECDYIELSELDKLMVEKQDEQKPANNHFTPEQADVLDKHIDEFIKQKPIDKIKSKFKVGDIIRHKDSLAEYIIESISGGCYHGKGWGLSIDCDEDYELVEQKPVWSEEDEKMWSTISDLLWEGYKLSDKKVSWNKIRCWLLPKIKSLKERYTWKPSEEQIKLLREVQQALLGKDCHNRFVNFMYELKRLREE